MIVKIERKSYIAARVIYFLSHGEDPASFTVDHIDRNSLNNNVSNLRLLTMSRQNCNTKKRSDNTSGCRGVSWHSISNKWVVQMWHDKKKVYLGCYSCKLEAATVYNSACSSFYPDLCATMQNDLTKVLCDCSMCSRN